MWLQQTSTRERRTLLAGFLGYGLDGFDFMIYTFIIPTLLTAWTMTRAEAGYIATAALLTSAIGGWVAGILADRYGRVRILQLTVLWFALFTFLSGFTHSYAELLVTRALQGFGFGGEWSVGSLLVAETIEARHRGKAVGLVQSSWAVGWAAAALAFWGVSAILPAELAWRILFWLGCVPGLLILYIRRRVQESPIYLAARSRAESQSGRSRSTHPSQPSELSQSTHPSQSTQPSELSQSTHPSQSTQPSELSQSTHPSQSTQSSELSLSTQPSYLSQSANPSQSTNFWAIFGTPLRGTTVLASLLCCGMLGAYYSVTTWLPTYLKSERHLSVTGTSGYLLVLIAGSFAGYLTGAWLSDALGRRRCFMVFAASGMLLVLAYTRLPITDLDMLLLGFPLGFFLSGIFSGMGAFLTELYPNAVRGSGQGFCYNFGRAMSALCPALIGAWSVNRPLGNLIGGMTAAAYALVIVSAWALPETRGRSLAEPLQ